MFVDRIVWFESSFLSMVCPHWHLRGEAKKMCRFEHLLQSGLRYEFDFVFIHWWSNLDRYWTYDNQNKGCWPLKFEIENNGTMNYFLKFGKENLYHEAIKEFFKNGNQNLWTLWWNEISWNHAEILLDLPWKLVFDWSINDPREHPSIYSKSIHDWASSYIVDCYQAHFEIFSCNDQFFFFWSKIFFLWYVTSWMYWCWLGSILMTWENLGATLVWDITWNFWLRSS